MILDLKYVNENGKKVLYAYMPKWDMDMAKDADGDLSYVIMNINGYEWRKVNEEDIQIT